MNPPVSSSTIDTNPPTAIDFLNRKQQGFCYFVVSNQGQKATEITTPSEESTLTSTWIFKTALSRSFIHADIRPENVLIGYTLPDIRFCDFASPVLHTNAGQTVFGYLTKRTDTHHLDTPQITRATDPVEQDVRALLVSSHYETFDTQASYDLTDAFAELIDRSSKQVIRALTGLINRQELNSNLICEALVSIGRLQDENTKSDRFDLLVTLLDHPAPIVRDGAIMGLSFMDNTKAIPYLRRSLMKETVRTLKGNIEIAIKDLETT